jgi:hypothetical protein
LIALSEELESRALQNNLMGRTLVLEFKSFKFENKIKSMTFPHYLFTKNQLIKYGIILLNQAWPVEATRLMGLRLQNMRDRKRDKGVKVCPEVHMSEVAFLEPIEKSLGEGILPEVKDDIIVAEEEGEKLDLEGSTDPKV